MPCIANHCFHKRIDLPGKEICCECEIIRDVESQVPLAGLVDEFGLPLPSGETLASVKMEDLELIRGFLGNLKDSTLSRGIHRVLTDLLERLPQ